MGIVAGKSEFSIDIVRLEYARLSLRAYPALVDAYRETPQVKSRSRPCLSEMTNRPHVNGLIKVRRLHSLLSASVILQGAQFGEGIDAGRIESKFTRRSNQTFLFVRQLTASGVTRGRKSGKMGASIR